MAMTKYRKRQEGVALAFRPSTCPQGTKGIGFGANTKRTLAGGHHG